MRFSNNAQTLDIRREVVSKGPLLCRILLLLFVLPFLASSIYTSSLLYGNNILALHTNSRAELGTTSSNDPPFGTIYFVRDDLCEHTSEEVSPKSGNVVCFTQLSGQIETMQDLYDYESISKTILNAQALPQNGRSLVVYAIDQTHCVKFHGMKYCRQASSRGRLRLNHHESILGEYETVDQASTTSLRLARPSGMYRMLPSPQFFSFPATTSSSSNGGFRRNPYKAQHNNIGDNNHENKGAIHLVELMQRPAMMLIAGLQIALAFFYWNYKVPPSAVAKNYQEIKEEGHAWRLISGALAHFEIWHCGLNMLAFYNISMHLEDSLHYSSPVYLGMNISLVAICGAVWFALQHELPPARRGPTVGYSGILFALSVISTLQKEGLQTCPVPFMDNVCFSTMKVGGVLLFSVSPWVQLGIAQVLLPRVSWTGHLAGVLVGFAFMWGLLPYLAFPSLNWQPLYILFLWRIKRVTIKSSSPHKSTSVQVHASILLLALIFSGGIFQPMNLGFSLLALFHCFVEMTEHHSSICGFAVALAIYTCELSVSLGTRAVAMGLWKAELSASIVQVLQLIMCVAMLVKFIPRLSPDCLSGIFRVALGPVAIPWREDTGLGSEEDVMLPLANASLPTPDPVVAMNFPGAGQKLGGGR